MEDTTESACGGRFAQVLPFLWSSGFCQSEKLRSRTCGQSAALMIMAPCWAALSPVLGKCTYGLIPLVTVFLVWIQTVVLCECVWICIFLLCPDLFIKRKTHLHKKASEHRKNVYFVFLSVAPRHAGLWLPLRDFEDWLSSQTRLPPPPLENCPF